MRLFLLLGWQLACHVARTGAQPDPNERPPAPVAEAAPAKPEESVCACPEGWECKREGLCVPPDWNTTTACDGAVSSQSSNASECSKLVADTLEAGRQWLLVISSGEDRESLVAAETMSNNFSKEWRASADAMLVRVEAARGSLSQETYANLKAILAQAWEQRPFQQVDVSRSQCADAMDATHRRCFYNLVKVMSGAWVQRSWFPSKIVSTQSRYLGSLARAADYVKRKTGRPMQVDCYLMELMPNLNSPFFKPMKIFADSQYKATAQTLRLHVVTPLRHTRADIAKESGLKASQVIFEDLMPVSGFFLNGSLPRPGEAADLELRASTPQEKTFLGGDGKVISIEADDTVSLVAFGPQPIPETLQSYMTLLTTAGPVQRKNAKAASKGFHWIFIDAGSPEWKDHESFYNNSIAMAEVFNTHQEEAGGRTRLMPFSHQLGALRRLKGRAELIITFAGNFQAGELIALAHRGDERHILIEVGGLQGLTASAQKRMAADSWWEREAWEKTAFLSMDPLEARNYQYLAKKLDATLTTTHTLTDAWEDAGMKVGGFCSELGACSTQIWDGPSVCVSEDPRCQKIVSQVVTAARSWTLLLTSSGGGGHMVAANVLGRKHASAWYSAMATAASDLEANREMMTRRGYEGLRAMMEFAKQGEPVIKIDLMNSACTNLLGEHGLGMGKAFSGVWNLGQSLGSVRALTGMSKAQGLEDDVFHRQCQKYMRNVIGGNRLMRVTPPSSVVSCQPMQHSAIAAALDEVSTEAGEELTLDIYLTELPTTHSVSFFDPLRIMAEHFPQAAGHVRLHIVEPPEGPEMIAQRTGLNVSQVIIEDFMPVDERLSSNEFPGPGSAMSISLEAGSERELAFLGRQKKVFNISEKDTITLVMLGSQPTVSTMREYVERFVQSTPRQAAEDPDALHWVFLAAGDPSMSTYDKLYISLADLADRFNFLQRMSDGRVRLVPFTRQPVTALESRADVTLTRSGGITSGELLAMSKRGDRRKVLLHLEVPKDQQSIEPEADSHFRADWEKMALVEGMVEWEMGNALYLKQVLNATLVTPKKLPSVW